MSSWYSKFCWVFFPFFFFNLTGLIPVSVHQVHGCLLDTANFAAFFLFSFFFFFSLTGVFSENQNPWMYYGYSQCCFVLTGAVTVDQNTQMSCGYSWFCYHTMLHTTYAGGCVGCGFSTLDDKSMERRKNCTSSENTWNATNHSGM